MKRDLETAMETDISPVSTTLSPQQQHFSEYFQKRQRVLETELTSPVNDAHTVMQDNQTLGSLELCKIELNRMLNILEVDTDTRQQSWLALERAVESFGSRVFSFIA